MTLLMRDQENVQKGKEEVVVEMIKNHFPIETIQKLTGVPLERIEELRDSLEA